MTRLWVAGPDFSTNRSLSDCLVSQTQFHEQSGGEVFAASVASGGQMHSADARKHAELRQSHWALNDGPAMDG